VTTTLSSQGLKQSFPYW